MPQPNSYIYREGVSPNTYLLNTQRVKLYSTDADNSPAPGNVQQIGLVQSWSPSHSRSVEPIRGIGFGDQIAELGVGVTDLTASCTIMMMYLKDIMQAFGYKSGSSGLIRSLKHHKWPFDVKEEIVVPTELVGVPTTGNPIITWYIGCWLSDYSKSFSIGETSTAQDASMQVTDVYALEPLGPDADVGGMLSVLHSAG